MQTIAIQGTKGSFHHIAAQDWFGDEINLVECKTFREVFKKFKNNQADYSVVAIENSLYGSINEVYDLLLKYRFYIIGEISERINQCLIGINDIPLEDVLRVHSHPVALAQCQDFLDKYLTNAERIENNDTADSVRLVKEMGINTELAIASPLAAKLYNMHVIKANIENTKTNYTRFLILSKNNLNITGANKASLVVETDHKPGALYKLLGYFANDNINLTKLQSRPIQGKVWHYQFYIDVEIRQDQLEKIIEIIISNNYKVTVLGFYKKFS